jgi:hypothetical protein
VEGEGWREEGGGRREGGGRKEGGVRREEGGGRREEGGGRKRYQNLRTLQIAECEVIPESFHEIQHIIFGHGST